MQVAQRATLSCSSKRERDGNGHDTDTDTDTRREAGREGRREGEGGRGREREGGGGGKGMRTRKPVSESRGGSTRGCDAHTLEQALVAVDVADDLDVGVVQGVLFDQDAAHTHTHTHTHTRRCFNNNR